MERLNINTIKQMIKDGKIRWTNHVIVRLFQRNISQEDILKAPSYEIVMRRFKKWLGELYQIEGIYTFGNLDLMCFNNTDKKSSNKYNHPRFINNIKNNQVIITCTEKIRLDTMVYNLYKVENATVEKK